MKIFKLLISSSIVISLMGCASTNSYWKEPLPDNPNSLSSAEKKRLYEHFSIDEISVFEISEDNLKTKSGDVKYSIKTFYPNILKVAPELESDLKDIQIAYQYRGPIAGLLFGLSLTPILLSSLSTDLDYDTRNTYYLGSLAGMLAFIGIDFGFLFFQQNKYNNIKDKYNEALKSYIFDSTFSRIENNQYHSVDNSVNLPTHINIGWSF